MTGAKRWFASSFSSATSSMLAGNRGSSSTVTMWTSAQWGRASSSAAVRAFRPPTEPSFAAKILVYISPSLRNGEHSSWSLADKRLERGLEPALGNQSRHHGAADHGGQEDRVLALVDDVIGQAVESRNRSECQAGRHHQRRVHPLFPLEAE